MSPYEAIGKHGGLQHIMMAIGRSLDWMDFESLLYGVKLIHNLSSSAEMIFVIGESGYIDYLCRIIQRLKEGVKSDIQDQKLKKYSKLIIVETLKAIKSISCNSKVQYNKIVLVEKSQFLETFKQLLMHYPAEIEYHQNQQCE